MGPLCQFLNHDATNPSSSTTSSTSTFYTKTPCPPDDGMPFPHVHTRAKLDGEMAFLCLITWVWPFVLAVPVLMVLGSIGTILYHCGWISRAPYVPIPIMSIIIIIITTKRKQNNTMPYPNDTKEKMGNGAQKKRNNEKPR